MEILNGLFTHFLSLFLLSVRLYSFHSFPKVILNVELSIQLKNLRDKIKKSREKFSLILKQK